MIGSSANDTDVSLLLVAKGPAVLLDLLATRVLAEALADETHRSRGHA